MDQLFLKKVHKTDSCWLWKGSSCRGYGNLGRNGRSIYAHRYVMECLYGPIPKGLVVDHKCRNNICVNPDHLRIVTQSVNCRENVVGHPWQIRAAKTHCSHGHEYFGNAYIETDKLGRKSRKCKICIGIRKKAFYQKSKMLGIHNGQR